MQRVGVFHVDVILYRRIVFMSRIPFHLLFGLRIVAIVSSVA